MKASNNNNKPKPKRRPRPANSPSFYTRAAEQLRTSQQPSARPDNVLEALEEFEDFRADILPKIRDAMRAGKSSKEISEMAKSYAAARIASIMALEPDSGKALAAAKDILDRTDGKPVERKEFQHKLGKLREEELDALLISSMSELEDEDANKEE